MTLACVAGGIVTVMLLVLVVALIVGGGTTFDTDAMNEEEYLVTKGNNKNGQR